jgi:hypothetical protein
MGGGLMQLVAYGAQDIYLTGNPQITFFKVVYRRHTNFSMEAIQQTLNGTTSASGSQTVTVSRNGDLVHKTYLVFKGSVFGFREGKVYDLIDNVELEIGGQRIDQQHGDWNAIWWDLTTPASKRDGLRSMFIDFIPSDETQSGIYYPLNFWFCRNPGLALPLIALQYHEVKLKMKYSSDLPGGTTAEAWCDYIYLDTDERRRFAQVSHEYLIEQVQRQVDAANTTSLKLNFNHPVKELIWVNAGASSGSGAGCQFAPLRATANVTNDSTYTGDAGQDQCKVKLVLNGHDRIAFRPAKYFKEVQPYQHHTHTPTSVRRALSGASGFIDTASAGVAMIDISRKSRILSGNLHITTLPGQSDQQYNLCGGDAASNPDLVALSGKTSAISNAVQTITFKNSVASATNGLINSATAIETLLDPDSVVGVEMDIGTAGDATGFLAIEVEEFPTLIGGDAFNTSDIYCYSFALKPEEHQPSGTCNFSRIDNAQLVSDQDFGHSTGSIKVFAVNYNVLRIMSGMGGLAYSN